MVRLCWIYISNWKLSLSIILYKYYIHEISRYSRTFRPAKNSPIFKQPDTSLLSLKNATVKNVWPNAISLLKSYISSELPEIVTLGNFIRAVQDSYLDLKYSASYFYFPQLYFVFPGKIRIHHWNTHDLVVLNYFKFNEYNQYNQ
jgi:hypothetical protein